MRPMLHRPAMGIWQRLLAWIDRDIPFLQSQQLVAISPLIFTLFVFPGPGTPAMSVAFGFWIVCLAMFCWRLIAYVRRRRPVDRRIRKGMFRRFRNGRGLPRIGDR